MNRAGVIAVEIAVCGVLFRCRNGMIRQSHSRLRGQVLTTLGTASPLPCIILCLCHSHSLISKHRHDITASAPRHETRTLDAIWTTDTMRRASTAETNGHSRTYSISTVSKISFLYQDPTLPRQVRPHRKERPPGLRNSAFRHSAA